MWNIFWIWLKNDRNIANGKKNSRTFNTIQISKFIFSIFTQFLYFFLSIFAIFSPKKNRAYILLNFYSYTNSYFLLTTSAIIYSNLSHQFVFNDSTIIFNCMWSCACCLCMCGKCSAENMFKIYFRCLKYFNAINVNNYNLVILLLPPI